MPKSVADKSLRMFSLAFRFWSRAGCFAPIDQVLSESVSLFSQLLRVITLPKFKKKFVRKKPKVKVKTVRKDPLYVDGERPRPMYVDYKDVELLKKLINRHGRLVARRKTGCTAVSQHALADAVKRARFMALLPYAGD